ncbi:PREDICTED: kinase suppressor of Ras 1-like [Amphimedon queenslandica]|uniref:Protein kinase domain-containing protein n=1 Tax=Amphimedon queenslandica TaxID=400682 RepID=A0A1X7UTN6_AMPQE|nr:PREDICTED: kinase suppressor of Ras 1-like [Amphimedon queenslandica]|eukprot:XP_019852299.1 PREDICTED: kinase suppressor of Ras 1-like [Amphimedon queenslandica]
MSTRRDILSLLHHQQKTRGTDQSSPVNVAVPSITVSSPRSRSNSRNAVIGGNGYPQPPASPLLHWSTGRRVWSEPGGSSGLSASSLLVDSGRSSLTSYGSQESLLFTSPLATDSDVFSDCYTDDEEEEEEEDEIEEVPLSVYLQGKWKEWMVGSEEIQLYGEAASSCKETVQKGYWHGNVWVHQRTIKRQEDVRSFANEVNTLCCIRHENIQLFMGVCLDLPAGDTFGIIMSEVKGDTLYNHIHKLGHNFTTPSKLKILRQISEGMEYLHAKGIQHGGLSSKLVTINHRVCISLSFHNTNNRQLEGCDLPYLTPEEIRSITQLSNGYLFLPTKPTPSTDIFAFGTIAYELTTLKLPFLNQSLLDLIWSVGNNGHQSLKLLPRSCFRSVIHRCWSHTRRTTFKDILSSIQDNTSFPPTRFSSTSLPLSSQHCTLRQ